MVTNYIPFEQTEMFLKGFKGETIIAQSLRAERYYVVITADNRERGRNGAPGARSDNGFITLPDLDVAKHGYRGFVEVKTKNEANWTNITKRLEHGIGLKKFEMYQRAQDEFGTVIYLCVYELKTGAVLFSPINDLLPLARYYYGKKMDLGGMIFFPRASFGLWGKVVEVKGDLYKQLDLFNPPEGEGDKLFKVIRHDTKLQ